MEGAGKRAAVATIPTHLPFLDTLAARLLVDVREDPLALSRMTVLLPTRRAGRALAEAFLRQCGNKPLLLPRLVPVGDVDDEELAFLPSEAGVERPDLPPAIPEPRRRLLLTRLVMAWNRELRPGQAALLARALARFLDEAQTEGAGFERLAELVPDELARHWQRVLEFLRIVTDHWPRMLEERGALDPAERRNRALAAQTEAWCASPPANPVIAAGITGGIPSVAALMETVARLPQGVVVLPGLDRAVSEEDWQAILVDATHPQHLMASFLQRLEIAPASVGLWEIPEMAAGSPARTALVMTALLPATCTERWRDTTVASDTLRGLRRLDCAGPQEEAQTIALLLRQKAENPDLGTAALVTPDRGLARRVAAEVKRWGIDIDDSAGVPLNKTPPGMFLRLLLDLVDRGAAPVPLLAVLKHPLAAGGLAPEEFRAGARALEEAVLRGVRPAPGLDGIEAALEGKAAVERAFLGRLRVRLAPLVEAMAAPEIGLRALVAAHVSAAEALASSAEEPGDRRLWREEAGEAASALMAELLASSDEFPLLRGVDYPALFESLVSGAVVRPRWGRHPRLFIWGLLEARLQRADLMILGGLNEGVWPGDPAEDPWMSRPMRRGFGIAPPERRIGEAALDFALALGAPEVVLTRAERERGAPTLPSRWLLRLDAVLRAAGRPDALTTERDVLSWQAALDQPPREERLRFGRPEPRPPVEARPRSLSVTSIETWMRDPYAIYARHVLGLRALEPIDAEPKARERGTFIHEALDAFVTQFPGALPPDAEARLLSLGREKLGALLTRPGIWAFWWPRFERIARWFLAEEQRRRADLTGIATEVTGTLQVSAPRGPFTLKANADRIERRGGELVIVDYKTGAVPKSGAVESGLNPQLSLEAAIAEAGGFTGVPQGLVAALEYWRLSGLTTAGEVKTVATGEDVADLIARALAGLRDLVLHFDDPSTPYLAVPDPERAPRYSDYTHLERVKEWRASVGDGT